MNILEEDFTVVLHSPSGATDIMVLALALINDLTNVFMDYGTGKNRKRLSLGEIRLLQTEKEALVGFHSFTGNDYIPSIFRKGKKHCWSIAKSSETFLEAFSELGADWEMTGEVVLALEKYVCALYRSKNNSVNELRYELFLKKKKKEDKVIDLAAVPSCFSSLYLQIKRANYVSKIWKSTATPQLSLPPMEKHGWNADGSIMWITETYPENVSELLINDEDDSGSESESAIDIVDESDIISNCESDTSSEEI